MTFLVVTEVFPPRTGGSGRWLWEIYRRMPREELLVAAGEAADQESFDRSHDVRVERMRLAFPTWGVASAAGLSHYRAAARKLRGLIDDNHFEAIHCGKLLPEGFLAWWLRRRTGLPYICYVHGEELRVVQTSRELKWMARRVLAGAQTIIANSRHTAELLGREWQVPSERVQLLYPGVDTSRFVPAARCEQTRARLGWGNRPVVLTVGRLQIRKGQDQMIRALRQIRQTIPDVLYEIVGDGEERPRLETLVRDEGVSDHVQFRGEASDAEMIECYQQCDLFALPNREVAGDFEGFGMVLLEAQACGKPVLAGASGGTAETMRIPETGRIVDCSRPEPLAEAIAELLSDRPLRERMGTAARRWAVENFDWEALSRMAGAVFHTTEFTDGPQAAAADLRAVGDPLKL